MNFNDVKEAMISVQKYLINNNMDLYKKINRMDTHIFEQLWGNTSKHVGGWGGCAMTRGITIVLTPKNCLNRGMVFFDGEYGYTVGVASDNFKEDLYNKKAMAGLQEWGVKYHEH